MVVLNELIAKAKALPLHERAEFACQLLDTLSSADENSDDEYEAELDRRIKSIKDGTAVFISEEELKQGLERRFK
jgi:putative addiction module component (TIGR02574 family)